MTSSSMTSHRRRHGSGAIGSGSQSIGFQDLNEKLQYSEPAGRKTREAHKTYIPEKYFSRTRVAKFSDILVVRFNNNNNNNKS